MNEYTPYEWRFDFDGGVEEDGHFIASSPHIYIVDQDGDDWLEVIEEPIPLVEYPDMKDEDWQIPESVQKLLNLLNKSLEEEQVKQ